MKSEELREEGEKGEGTRRRGFSENWSVLCFLIYFGNRSHVTRIAMKRDHQLCRIASLGLASVKGREE